jgi:UDP-N-acetylmuramyl pentapeptide phosphotransferase/UDP-N-acetylglucosamine-1-phosphate transferase
VGAGARPFGFFLTLFAVWAAINAFNMVDGIDGLLGGLSSVSLRQRALSCGLMASTAWRCGVLR